MTTASVGAVAGRRWTQAAFERLHRLALVGMGMGGAADHPNTSGEAHVLALLPDAPVIVDAGANVGDYSRLALAVRPQAIIHAFEPDAAAFAQLLTVPGIHAHNTALGADAGTLELFRPEPGSALASPYQRHHATLRWDDAVRVPVARLDDLDLGPIELLKVDVEGHELAVIAGARASIDAGRIERIQFEFGGTAIDARVYLRDFFEALPGYRFARIIRGGLVPITYDERWEIFTTTNFLAVREPQSPSHA